MTKPEISLIRSRTNFNAFQQQMFDLYLSDTRLEKTDQWIAQKIGLHTNLNLFYKLKRQMWKQVEKAIN